MRKKVYKWSALVASAALVGCGGGGSGSVAVESPSYELTGSATKGPMNKAKVTVFSVNSDGSKGAQLGQGESGVGGGYTVKYKTDYTGPILVEVVATDETEIEDEETGTKIKAPGLILRAALQPPSTAGGSLTVQVNPLTEVAVSDAFRKAGGLKQANIEQANSDLVGSLGFNPQTDAPEFDSQNRPTNRQAVVLAAISKMANDNSLATCSSKSDLGEKVKCVVKAVADSDAGLVGVPELQATVDAVAAKANLEPPVIKTPEGTPVTETTAVAQAKSLMNTLRSNAKALAVSELSLQTKLTEVQTALETSVQPVVDSTFEMLRTMDFGVQLLEDAQAGSGVYSRSRTGTYYGAGCTVFTGETNDSGNYTFRVAATAAENAKVVACSSYVAVNNNQLDTSVTGVTNTWRWRHRLLIAPKAAAAGTYEVKTTARREYGTCTNKFGSCGTFTQTNAGTADQGKPMPTVSYPDNSGYSVQRGEEGMADFARTLTNGSPAVSLSGKTAPSLVYRGLGINPVLDSGNGRYHEVDLAVAAVTEGNVQRLVLSKDAFIKFFSKSAADGSTVFRSSIGIGKDSYIQAPVVTDAKDGTEAFKLAIGYVAGNSALRGSLEATTALWDKSKTVYLPTKMVFAGRLETRATSSSEWVDFLRGSLAMEAVNFATFNSSLPLSKSNPQTMKATLNAAVTIPNRPVLAVRDLTIVSTDMGPDDNEGSLTGQYVQGSVVINLKGASGSGSPDKMTLTSSTGVKLDYDGSKTVHPMTKSGITVGEYDASTQRINYIDGTLEQY